jgi:thiamine monophosphate synthase
LRLRRLALLAWAPVIALGGVGPATVGRLPRRAGAGWAAVSAVAQAFGPG